MIATDLSSIGVPVAALVVSMTTLLVSSVALRSRAGSDYVADLERRILNHEDRLKACEQARENLFSENIRLMREITKSIAVEGARADRREERDIRRDEREEGARD